MKLVLYIILFICITTSLSAQELNFGGFLGTPLSYQYSPNIEFGGVIEFKPLDKRISFNNQYYFFFQNNNELLRTTSLYLKLDFGNKFKISPTWGLFIRSNKNKGTVLGLNFQYELKEKKNKLFFQTDLMTDYYSYERR